MKKRTAIFAGCASLLLLAAAGGYGGIAWHYQTHFLEHTVVNGINVSDLTVQEAEQLIARQAETYSLTVQTKDGTEEVLGSDAIGYHFVSDGAVEALLQTQNGLMWLPAFLSSGSDYTMPVSVTYEKEKLSAAVKALNCMQESTMVPPADAYVALQNGVYEIVPETEGNYLSEERVRKALEMAADAGETHVNLLDEGCYEMPSVRSDSGALKAEAAVKNQYSQITVTYQMGCGMTEILDASVTAGWFSFDEENQPILDETAARSWIDQLADRYDTIGKQQAFRTSNGETVFVEARTYGWQMDRESEKTALCEILRSGASAERTVLWLEGAFTRGENDIGSTYVEIDYTNQRMWYYKDGVLLVETPVVTGNVSAGMASPEGIFCLLGKAEDEILKGETYSTPVDYWMPFYGGVGIHDADSWRSTYGGSIYLTSGSHGCINTPTAKVAQLYSAIEIGTPIVCYSAAYNYGYPQEAGGGSAQPSNPQPANPQPSNPQDSDIIIIEEGSGYTEEGVPYTGLDLKDVIIN